MTVTADTDQAGADSVHLLDVGREDYGDAILIQLKGRNILIDGGHRKDLIGSQGHPSIPEQLRRLTGNDVPQIDLLVVSHAHLDHVGCLPELVGENLIRVRQALLADPDLSWGREIGEDAITVADPRTRAVVAALREEPIRTNAPEQALEGWLDDALTLEERYRLMVDSLKGSAERVTLHGRDDTDGVMAEFAAVGLEVLGPSRDQLLVCADAIGRAITDAVDAVSSLVEVDQERSAVALYREALSQPMADAAGSRPGHLVNLQSINLSVAAGSKRLYFGGDMQLVDPGTRNAVIAREMNVLRSRIRSRGPYAFVKLGHHGSANAADPDVLANFGNAKLFGICLGEDSGDHPDGSVLRALAARGGATWARTDRNGMSSFRRASGKWTLELSRGEPSDMTSSAIDRAVSTESLVPSPSVARTVVRGGSVNVGEGVEVVIRIPRGVTSVLTEVAVSWEAEPSVQPRPRAVRPEPDVDTLPILSVAGGRTLPPLLYVTDEQHLANNIGVAEARQAVAALGSLPGLVVDTQGADIKAAEGAVHQALGLRSDVVGVVIVGGYDVVPSHALDTLPANLTSRVRRVRDADRFVVWTDDLYGRPENRAPVPVSRVPDGRSATLLFSALSATAPLLGRNARGVRNSRRPFADGVYAPVSPTTPLDVCEPLDADTIGELSADLVYLMLHGNYRDTSRMWGEFANGDSLEGFTTQNVGTAQGAVVLTGACWGALAVDLPAARWAQGMPIGQRDATNAISLRYLAAGANAFVGCTGSHYSPIDPPYETMGGPLHQSFWNAVLGGTPAAQALLRAKLDYLRDLPHGLTDSTRIAFENKILWQFTCLGLGW